MYDASNAVDANGVLIENAQVELESFALLFEFDSDQRHIRHVLYNCAASRPGIEGKTKLCLDDIHFHATKKNTI